jgi:AraC-like DNA-binding protein
MEQHLAEPLSIDTLAAGVNLSASRFAHLFCREVGASPVRYLHALRMLRARVLLERTFLSVKEVMALVGCNDPSHFSRDFRRFHGLVPSACRLGASRALRPDEVRGTASEMSAAVTEIAAMANERRNPPRKPRPRARAPDNRLHKEHAFEMARLRILGRDFRHGTSNTDGVLLHRHHTCESPDRFRGEITMENRFQHVETLKPRLRTIAIAFAVALALSAPEAFAQSAKVNAKKNAFTVLPTVITSVTVVEGRLMANGLVGAKPFQTPITLTSTPGPIAAAATCPILNLRLEPIHLSVLGLNVDTSAICLDITAIQGALLGDLLCLVANLLNGGVAIDEILATRLLPDQLALLTNGLTQILNQAVFIPVSQSTALQGVTASSPAAMCDVLNLALGPLDLNLLGLRVELDDCANGPVTVAITATPGGGLLGDLLCSLAGGPNNTANTRTLTILQRIADVIGRLVAVVV